MLRTARVFRASHWRSCEAGNVATIAAVCFVFLCGFIAAAIDFSRVFSAKTRLQQAVDAATLAASSDPYYTSEQATQLALTYFGADGTKTGASSPPVVTITRNGTEISVAATMTLPTTFAAVIGINQMPVSANARAGLSLGDFEVYAAIDMSASLGLGADAKARKDLEALTKPYQIAGSGTENGCQFACHQRDGWEPPGQTSYQMARAAGIPLREDVLNAAFSKFVDAFMPPGDAAVAADHKRMAVLGFSDNAQVLAAATNNVTTVKNAPALFPEASRWNTKYVESFSDIRRIMGTQGSGLNGNARKTLLLITDGVRFDRNDLYAGAPLDTALCDTVKSDGFTIAVIEVQYQDSTGDMVFDDYVASYYPKVSPALKACASPGFYFLATDSDASTLGSAFSKAGDSLRTRLVLRQ